MLARRQEAGTSTIQARKEQVEQKSHNYGTRRYLLCVRLGLPPSSTSKSASDQSYRMRKMPRLAQIPECEPETDAPAVSTEQQIRDVLRDEMQRTQPGLAADAVLKQFDGALLRAKFVCERNTAHESYT